MDVNFKDPELLALAVRRRDKRARQYIAAVVKSSPSITAAAERLKVSRMSLYRWSKKKLIGSLT